MGKVSTLGDGDSRSKTILIAPKEERDNIREYLLSFNKKVDYVYGYFDSSSSSETHITVEDLEFIPKNSCIIISNALEDISTFEKL